MGVEPTTFCSSDRCTTIVLYARASYQQLASVPAWWAVSVNLTEEAKLASRHDVSYNGSSPLAKIMHSSATVRSSDIAFHLTVASLLDERSVAGVGFEPTMLGYEPSDLDQASRSRGPCCRVRTDDITRMKGTLYLLS